MNCLQMLFSQHTAWNIQQGALDGTAVKMEQKSRKEKQHSSTLIPKLLCSLFRSKTTSLSHKQIKNYEKGSFAR